MILSNQSTVSVLPQSKKITKPKHDLPKRPTKDTQNDDYSVLETGYDIFLKEERDEILAILKRQILAFLGLDSSLMQNEAVEWTDLFGEIGTKSLNQMLIKVIPQYRPNLELTTRALINLRKKVKGWLTSEGASEKRGDPLIHADEMPRFKQALVEVMKVRNFNQLRKDILPVIEDIRKQSLKRFDDTMFSKKFWSTFLNKEENKDIKDIWVSLPQKKNKCKKVANAADPYDSEVEKMETEDHLLSKLSLALKQDNKKFWSEEEKEAKQEADLQAYISNFDESEPQYPVERVLADTEGFMTETSASSHNKHIWAEDKQNFIGEFWVQWNQRQYTDDAKFMMPVDDVLFKESEQQL